MATDLDLHNHMFSVLSLVFFLIVNKHGPHHQLCSDDFQSSVYSLLSLCGLTCCPQPEVGLSVKPVTPESCSLWAVGTTLTCETTHNQARINKTHTQLFT